MQKGDPTVEEMESALLRLMPVAVSQAGQERMEGMIDGLAGEVRVGHFRGWKIFVGGAMAAAIVGAVFVVISPKDRGIPEPGVVVISEVDRVEGFRDEGLFVDAGGSALRKVRVRVIEESNVRDEETGVVVVLSEPREEMYMIPVNRF